MLSSSSQATPSGPSNKPFCDPVDERGYWLSYLKVHCLMLIKGGLIKLVYKWRLLDGGGIKRELSYKGML